MADLLEPVAAEVVLAHPLGVRAIAAAKVKTDRIDSDTLVHLLQAVLYPLGLSGTVAIRELRDLLRLRTAVKNKVHAALAKEGLTVPATDLFGRKEHAVAVVPLLHSWPPAPGLCSVKDACSATARAARRSP